jgi:hypothetical protein
VILLAKRCERQVFPPSRGITPAQKLGLRYERKVFKQLTLQFGAANVEHNPWYNYEDETGFHACCPDIIIWDRIPVILEVKYTLCPEAKEKLQKLYAPVVLLSLKGIAVRTCIITKNLGGMPQFLPPPYLIQWLGRGPIEIPGLKGGIN